MDSVDLFDKGSAWAKQKIEGAKDSLDAPTPCGDWDVRTLINHLISGLEYFQKRARGEEAPPPSAGDPPDVLDGGDPGAKYEAERKKTLEAFHGVDDKTLMALGFAFVDQVVHGNDLAKATGQDDTIPSDLAEAAFGMVTGNLTDENRGTAFGPAVDVSDDAGTQDKLLAYLGRSP